MKKVLIVTYYWPPAGGPGVQRVLKFARYLPEFGWEPLILTVKHGEYPARDETLLSEVPEGIRVCRAPAFEPFTLYKKFSGDRGDGTIPVGVLSQKDLPLRKRIAKWIRLNLVVPDAKRGWKPGALKAGRKLIEETGPDVIFSSSPPPTVHLIAEKLAKTHDLPWVADLRDPWSKIHYYQNNRLEIIQRLDAALERRTLSAAGNVTTVSEHFGELIGAEKDKLVIIPNGYDPDDFAGAKKREKDRTQFVISHVGGLNENRFYPEFFRGLSAFADEHRSAGTTIRCVFAGKIPEPFLKKIRDLSGENVILVAKGYLPHREAVRVMEGSDLLLLFMERSGNYSGHIPGKLFEYLATGNYILGAGHKEGNASRILGEAGAGKVLGRKDDFNSALGEIYEKWKQGTLRGADTAFAERYSRKALTGRLAEVLEGAQWE